jgi:hypothetical protein
MYPPESNSARHPAAACPLQKTFTNISDAISTIINFYVWLLTSIWSAVSGLANSAGDLVSNISGNGGGAAPHISATAGGL